MQSSIPQMPSAVLGAIEFDASWTVVVAILGILFVLGVFALIWASRYTKVGPN